MRKQGEQTVAPRVLALKVRMGFAFLKGGEEEEE